ncbi:MAG TPA: DUF3025 domain-containing protein [Oxalicibacterium sp.]|nr:DUF3025 domain-containing protein [Oxalicibacterium sp.]
MAADFLARIDWARPWLAHIREAGEAVANASDWRDALNERATQQELRNRAGLPVRFVSQSELPAGVAYETFIHDTGGVPTRDNLHDFFNALVWLTFPHIKVQLNALQASEIARAGRLASTDPSLSMVSSGCATSRGKLRDAATIFDENAVLLVTADAGLVDALRSHAWQEAFVARREAFMQGCVLLFGHALMEKLVQPYKSITGHMWVVPETVAQDFQGDSLSLSKLKSMVDIAVSAQLRDGLTTGDFSPLPMLGVPGWWEGQNQAFYADAAVFRPKRSR